MGDLDTSVIETNEGSDEEILNPPVENDEVSINKQSTSMFIYILSYSKKGILVLFSLTYILVMSST